MPLNFIGGGEARIFGEVEARVHPGVCECVHTYTHVWVCMCVYVYMCVCICACVYICKHVCVCNCSLLTHTVRAS